MKCQPMMASPIVTVLIPAHKASGFILQTLNSIASQTVSSFEVVISVDSLEGKTYDKCYNYSQRDQRFRVIQQLAPLGWTENCNFLLSVARTEYATFLPHDDLIAPRYLERLLAVLEKDPGIVLAFSDLVYRDESGHREIWEYKELDDAFGHLDQAKKLLTGQGRWWVPYRGVLRVAQAKQTDGLRRHGSGEHGAELPWLLRLSFLGKIQRVPEVLYLKHGRRESLSSRWKMQYDQTKLQHDADLAGLLLREIWVSDLKTKEKTTLAGPLTSKLSIALTSAKK